MKHHRLLHCLPLLLVGCNILQPVKDPAARHLLDPIVPYRAATSPQPVLAVARPSLPAYLDRLQLATRDAAGQVQVLDAHLWSEPLDSAIARVTAINLRRLTGATNIQPVGDFITLEYTSLVEVRIAQFDPAPSGALILQCTWKVQPVKGGDANNRDFRTEVQPDPTKPPVAARIAAMNEALARLAREIARSL